jgi:hypothetical protein
MFIEEVDIPSLAFSPPREPYTGHTHGGRGRQYLIECINEVYYATQFKDLPLPNSPITLPSVPMHPPYHGWRRGQRFGGPDAPPPAHPIRREHSSIHLSNAIFSGSITQEIKDFFTLLGNTVVKIRVERRGTDQGSSLDHFKDTLLIVTEQEEQFTGFLELAFDYVLDLLIKANVTINIEISHWKSILRPRVWRVGTHKIHSMWTPLESRLFQLLNSTEWMAMSFGRFGPETGDVEDIPVEVDPIVPTESPYNWRQFCVTMTNILDSSNFNLTNVAVRITRATEAYVATAIDRKDPLKIMYWRQNEVDAAIARYPYHLAGRSVSTLGRRAVGTLAGFLQLNMPSTAPGFTDGEWKLFGFTRTIIP